MSLRSIIKSQMETDAMAARMNEQLREGEPRFESAWSPDMGFHISQGGASEPDTESDKPANSRGYKAGDSPNKLGGRTGKTSTVPETLATDDGAAEGPDSVDESKPDTGVPEPKKPEPEPEGVSEDDGGQLAAMVAEQVAAALVDITSQVPSRDEVAAIAESQIPQLFRSAPSGSTPGRVLCLALDGTAVVAEDWAGGGIDIEGDADNPHIVWDNTEEEWVKGVIVPDGDVTNKYLVWNGSAWVKGVVVDAITEIVAGDNVTIDNGTGPTVTVNATNQIPSPGLSSQYLVLNVGLTPIWDYMRWR